ncbi:MAG: hypothetical protein HYY46_07175, partial [Deltaproteobacteria bacterium]|nr:hypothetical protein [Deltaproteobacteria bacterium]
MKIKVLCFIASANYSGATRFSMDVLKLWNKNLFDIRVIFSRYDDKKLSVISAELERLGVKFTVLNKVIPSRGVIWNKCVRRLDGILLRFPQKSIVRFKLKRICSDFKPDLIYSNSVSLPLADLRKYTGKTKVFYYVHLFPSAVSDPAKLTEAHIQKLNASDKIVVASSTVRNLLIERGLKRDLLTVSAESLLPPVKDLAARKIYRNRLGYTENQVVVGGSGAVSYRKGCDLFVEMARRVSSDLKNDQIQFL